MGTAPIALAGLAVAPVTMAVDPSMNWLAYIVGGGGLIGLLTLFVTTGRDLLKGRVKQIEIRDANLVTQRDTAWHERDRAEEKADRADARADCEARNARRLWDYATHLRRKLIMLGVTEDEMPKEPTLERCDLPPTP